ncbi:MAG TPA: hypothetical protein DCF68_12890 [Cyanothece sp. UBA12306]|nr:hypothetical protein [Cyanothece sp. UBA12306]
MKNTLRLGSSENLSTPDFMAIGISLIAAYLGLFSGHKSFSKELVLFLLFLNSLDLSLVLLMGKKFAQYKETISSFLRSPKFIGVDIFPALLIAEFVYGPFLKGFFLELMAFIATYLVMRVLRLKIISSLH